MEVVEKRNAAPKVWRGPYSLMTPHRDGRMEHPGDRVPCAASIQQSFKSGAPLMLPEGFEDASRYALKKRYRVHPFHRELTRRRYVMTLLAIVLLQVVYRYIYCVYHDMPDPLRTDTDRFMFWMPFILLLYVGFNIGNIFTNSLLGMFWRVRARFRK